MIQGNNATFSTTVELANPYPTLQWLTNNVPVDGATNTSLTLTNVNMPPEWRHGIRRCQQCRLRRHKQRNIDRYRDTRHQPATNQQTVNVADTAVFISGATGIPTPGLQWYKNNAAILNQTNSTSPLPTRRDPIFRKLSAGRHQ